MKNLYLLLVLFITGFAANAQLVTTDPPIPVVTEPVTVTFDATEGSGGLAGYTGDVYAHTGVITQYSANGSDWKYVMTGWGENTPETKLTRIGQDLYTLQITPNIRDYYGVPGIEQILQMAFVFRSGEQLGGAYLEGKTETFGDIFIDVIEEGLYIDFLLPQSFPVIVSLNGSFITEINANESDSVSLFIDDVLEKKLAGTYLKDTIVADEYGTFEVKGIAENETGMVADSFNYHVRPEVTIEALPAGIRDGINYTGSQSVTLCLMAPGKEFIYVIGDFNDWDINDNYFMKLTPDGMRFWLEIDGLVPGKEYVFQYYIDAEIKVGDPYADKVSDPWNDSYIPEATYPNLIDYPAGKTTGIATVLQTNQQAYNWEVEQFTPASVTDLVIYELLVRDFTTQQSYAAVIDKLDYLENLGVNAIELMPVNEFEGNLSWGYNPSFYFAPDKYYGPKNELKRLVDECHKRGIAVITDLVLNHSFDQSPLVQMYFDGNKPTSDNPWYNVNHNFANPDAQWGNDFNHESIYTQAFVDSVNSYWLSEYKMDGIRFDFTKGYSNTPHGTDDPWGGNYDADRIIILERIADEVWKRNPEKFVIFEHWGGDDEEKILADYGVLLWGSSNYHYGEGAMGYNAPGHSDFSRISYKYRNWNDPHVLGYMESHDEERLAYKCIFYGNSFEDYLIKDTTVAIERMAMNALFFFTVPGPKMIWQFEEMGYDYSVDYNGRTGEKPVRWDYLNDYRRKYLSDFYGALIKLRTEDPLFETTDFTLSVTSPYKKIALNSISMKALILGNYDVKEGAFNPSFPHTGTWYEYFTGQPFEVTDLAEGISLQAGEYRFYTDVQLATPQIGTGIFDSLSEIDNYLKVYPNPGSDFTIELVIDHVSNLDIDVYNLSGQKVANIYNGKVWSGSHEFTWSAEHSGVRPGIYLIRALDDNNTSIARIIIR
jgi:glycosidase